MKDIKLQANFDLDVENGDFGIDGAPATVDQQLIILARRGEYKNAPLLGVGIREESHSDNHEGLAQRIRLNFEADGLTVDQIRVSDNLEIFVNAYRQDTNG